MAVATILGMWMVFAGTGVWKSKRGTPLLACRRVFINDEQYGYNISNELISADEVSYAYDDIGLHAPTSVSEVGNRTTAEGKTYTANNLNQYIAIDDFAPEYDADGNQTKVQTETGIWTVTYNAENRPIRWQSGDTVITMAFDRMGRRVEMRTVKDGVETLQRFVYDNYLCIQQLRGSENTLFQSYVWDPTEPIATRPLIFIPSGSEVSYYFHDGNKNVSDLVDIQGRAVHYGYTPFGSPIASAPSENPYRFSSEVYDDKLDLVYYNYRHYNPIIGRWQSVDPLFYLDIRPSSSPEGVNLFLFCINNSILQTDHLGLKCRILRLIGHFAGKSEQTKGAIWDYYKSANLDECDMLFTISCHMDEFLSESEGVGKPPKNLWPPQEFATGTISAFAFPFLLDKSEKRYAMKRQIETLNASLSDKIVYE